jgi:hypothetical protein
MSGCLREKQVRKKLRFLFFFLMVIWLWLWASEALARLSNSECQRCHGKRDFKTILPSGEAKSLYIDFDLFYRSVHGKELCVYCHIDVKEVPCKGPLLKIGCRRCHYKGNLAGAPDLDIYEQYDLSVHGRAVALGDPKAPKCQDCHGSHYMLDKTDTLSRINKEHIPETCSQCHLNTYNIYESSIHGKALRDKGSDAPVCTDCHLEHSIKEHTDPKSSVFLTSISATCATCHANRDVIKKYGILSDPVETYEESFHGVALKFGARTSANCISCHGAHDILPASNPRSSIHPLNLPGMCGKCHPGAGQNFARGKIHIDPTKPEAGIIYYVYYFFKYFTLSVISALIIYIILDLRKKYKLRRQKA